MEMWTDIGYYSNFIHRLQKKGDDRFSEFFHKRLNTAQVNSKFLASEISMSEKNKNSSVDEVANVNVFCDDIVHVEASAYAHWTDFLSALIYAAANQGRSSTSIIILRCEPARAPRPVQ